MNCDYTKDKLAARRPEEVGAATVHSSNPAQALAAAASGLGAKSPDAQNYRFQDDQINGASKVERVAANIQAIDLIKRLEQEHRLPTENEKAILARYSGWNAAMRYVLEDRTAAWTLANDKELDNFAVQLRGILKENKRQLAQLLEHSDVSYMTPKHLVENIWKAIWHIGVKTERVLDTSAGIGNFFGFMPDQIRDDSNVLYGVEKVDIPAQIAGRLFPDATIKNGDFLTQSDIPLDYFDVAVGSISEIGFGRKYQYTTPYTGDTRLSIDAAFLHKSLQSVRPGGMVAFIVPRNFLDGNKDQDIFQRQLIARDAELVGAIRLPKDVLDRGGLTPDVIFLQKRESPVTFSKDSPPPDWACAATTADFYSKTAPLNRYFVENPDMIVGVVQPALGGEPEVTVAHDFPGYQRKLNQAVGKLPVLVSRAAADVARVRCPACGAFMDATCNNPTCPTNRGGADEPRKPRNGEILSSHGKLIRFVNGEETEIENLTTDDQERLTRLTAMKELALRLFNPAIANTPEWGQIQAALNAEYDAFVQRFGCISLKQNRGVFTDPELPILLSLEDRFDPETNTAQKSPVLTQAITKPYIPVEKVDTPKDAVAVSLAEMGRLDIGRAASLLGMSTDDALNLMLEQEAVFYDPTTREYIPAEYYLSGDVRAKLRDVEKIAAVDPQVERNVRALRRVLPERVPINDIHIDMSAGWIPADYVEEFAQSLLGTDFFAMYVPENGEWLLAPAWETRWRAKRNDPRNLITWGTPDITGLELIRIGMSGVEPTIYKKVGEKRVVDEEKTTRARAKLDEIRAAYTRFMREKHGDELEQLYNDAFNSEVTPDPDGSQLQLRGLGAAMPELRAHQRNGIWRIVHGLNNTGLFHMVGAGKSYTAIGASMELKRLGKRDKIMHVTANNTLEQYAADFYRMYPFARILTVSSDDLSGSNYETTLKKIRDENWDAVLVTHSAFERIESSSRTPLALLRQEIADLEIKLKAIQAPEAQRVIEREIQERKKEEAKLMAAEQSEKGRLFFQDLKVKHIFIDEWDRYKNLGFRSKRSSGRALPGIGLQPSQRAEDTFHKVMAIQLESGEDQGITPMTATPISNSNAEIFNVLRMTAYNHLRQKGLLHFDAYAGVFIKSKQSIEAKPSGRGYRVVTSFRFENVPEQRRLIRRIADVQLDPVKLGLPLPRLKGGKPTVVAVERTPAQAAFMQSLSERADRLSKMTPDEDNMLWIINDGRKAAIDMRLIDPKYPDDPNSKLNVAIQNIHDIYRRTTGVTLPKVEGKQNLTQMVFCDFGTPKPGEFNIYDEIRNKLVAMGVPREEIAFIQEAKNDEEKYAMFQKVNQGKIRVLVGSTETMGAGTNAQRLLAVTHDLDLPWRPRDKKQRSGRIIRQGNLNPEVEQYQYVTKDSFDVYTLQVLERKALSTEQLFSDDDPSRDMDDSNLAVLSYEEVKGLASGDPLISERVDVGRKLQSLSKSYLQHQRRQRKIKDRYTDIETKYNNHRQNMLVGQYMEGILKERREQARLEYEQLAKEIAKNEQWLAATNKHIADAENKRKPTLELATMRQEYEGALEKLRLKKRVLTEFSYRLPSGSYSFTREDVGINLEKIESSLLAAPAPTGRVMAGEIMGFQVYVAKDAKAVPPTRLEVYFASGVPPLMVYPTQETRLFSPRDPARGVDNLIESMKNPARWLREAQASLPPLEQELRSLKNEMEQPYEHQREYASLKGRMEEIDQHLKAIAAGHREQMLTPDESKDDELEPAEETRI